jgi:hypothetical protein
MRVRKRGVLAKPQPCAPETKGKVSCVFLPAEFFETRGRTRRVVLRIDSDVSKGKEICRPSQIGLTMTEPAELPENDSVPDHPFSRSALLRNLPYIVALALAIFGVAYTSFAGRPINGYWEFLAIAIGLVCIFTGWPNAPERETRFKLIWTQAAHWAAVVVAMNLILLQGFQQMMPTQAVGFVLMLLLGLGTFLAGLSLLSLRICFLGLAMALSLPAIMWFKQASLLLLLAGVAIAGLAVAFWPRGRGEMA